MLVGGHGIGLVDDVGKRKDFIKFRAQKQFSVQINKLAVYRIQEYLANLIGVLIKGDGGLGGKLNEMELIFQLGSRKRDPREFKWGFGIIDDRIFLILRGKEHLSRLNRLTVKGAATAKYKMDGITVDLAFVGVMLLPCFGIAKGGNVKARSRVVCVKDTV